MVYIFLADGFEEAEATLPIDILRRAGIDIKIVSVMNDLRVTGAHGITYTSDIVIDSVKDDAEMYILPGGTEGVENMSKCEKLCELLKSTDKYIAAICAAPTLIGKLRIINGRHAICYPSLINQMTDAVVTDMDVVVDGKLITSKGPGTSFEFGFKLLEILVGQSAAQKVRSAMLC